MPNEANELIPTRWSLIQRLKDWDDQASWREFFDIYWALLYGTARKAGLGDADAQDVVQSTVMELCKRIKTFQADPTRGSFKAWLLQLTRWRIADQVRRRRPEETARAHRAAGGASTADAGTATEERLPDPRRDPLEVAWEEDWEKTLVNAALAKVKDQVSARDFQVFVLLVVQGASPESVAGLTELSRGNVDVIKHRVGKLFAEAVKELNARWA